MSDIVTGMDISKPVGQRLSAAMQAEIEAVAPSTVNDGDITEPKLHDLSVSTRTLQDKAVTEPKYGDGSVSTRAIGAGQVTAEKMAPASITPENVAPGVPTSVDWNGNPISLKHCPLTAAQYAALDPGPDPTTLYYISA